MRPRTFLLFACLCGALGAGLLLVLPWLVLSVLDSGQVKGDALVIPNTFVPNTIQSSSAMNSNFTAISTWGNGLVDDANLKNAGITGSTKLVNASVTLAKLAASSVDSSKIVDGSIAVGDLGTGSVSSVKLLDNGVFPVDLNYVGHPSAPGDGDLVAFNSGAVNFKFRTIRNMGVVCFDCTTLTASQTAYCAPGTNAVSATESLRDVLICPNNGLSFHNMTVSSDTTLPSSYTFTLRKNAANTALTCSSAGTTCTDSEESVPVTCSSTDKMVMQVISGTGSVPGNGVQICVTTGG